MYNCHWRICDRLAIILVVFLVEPRRALVIGIRSRRNNFFCEGRDKVSAIFCRRRSIVVAGASKLDYEELFRTARYVRVTQGHEAAQPLYDEIVKRFPYDLTSGTRIAASPLSPARHDKISTVFTSFNRNSTTANRHHLREQRNKYKELLLQFSSLLERSYFDPISISQLVLGGKGHQESQKSINSNATGNVDAENTGYSSMCDAPLYLKHVSSGAKMASSPPPAPDSALCCLIHLFLLGLCVPKRICLKYFSVLDLETWEDLGVAFVDNEEPKDKDDVNNEQLGLVIPYVHVMPLQMNRYLGRKTLFCITDLHPSILSMTTLGSQKLEDGNDQGAVMYIGPDSIALIQHSIDFMTNSLPQDNGELENKPRSVVDVGTGSGVQALVLSAAMTRILGKNTRGSYDNEIWTRVTCIDINRRALEFARVNFLLNGLPEPTLILGDVRGNVGEILPSSNEPVSLPQILPWEQLLGNPTHIVANPPFLPVPPVSRVDSSGGDHDTRLDIQKRHGWFSSGGHNGDDVLRSVIQLAGRLLDGDQGRLAIVSEFMNPDSPDLDLLRSLRVWWRARSSDEREGGILVGPSSSNNHDRADENISAQAVLYTNEHPLSARMYAYRRASSAKEEEVWIDHLKQQGISHVSPGLLFLQKRRGRSEFQDISLQHIKVPKSAQGSIWTPSNQFAVDYTYEMNRKIFFGGENEH